jgi:hypothetical protein
MMKAEFFPIFANKIAAQPITSAPGSTLPAEFADEPGCHILIGKEDGHDS